MRFVWILILTTAALGQITVKGGVSVKGSVTISTSGAPIPPPLGVVAELPQVWADDHECDPPGGIYDVTKHIPGDYAANNAQQAWIDWQASGDQWWHIVVTHGTVIGPITALAKLVGGSMPSKCIVWDSDTPLTANRTVCAHGTQDNVATSTDPGVRNPDCNGSGMSYQLGQTLTSIPSGAFTLANGTATNTSAYNDVASMYTVECNTTNCQAVNTGAVDANGNGPNHFAIYNAELRVNSTKTCCFPFDMENVGSTVQSLPSHYHLDRVWSHGDATDAGKGTQGLTDNWRMNCGGNCSLSNSQSSKSIRPGSEGHGVYWADAQQLKIAHNWIEGMSINTFDGGITHSVPGGVSGRDLEVRRNRFTYPLPWAGHGSGSGSVCGTNVSCVRKNCSERKGTIRELNDGNICENVDNSGGQNGVLTDYNNRACTGATCDNYVQTIQQVNITNNIYRHGCGGLLFDANSGNVGSSGNSATTPGRNFYLYNTLFYDISTDNFGCNVSTGGTVIMGATNHDFKVTSVTRNGAGTVSTIILTGGTGENQTGLVSGDPILLTGCSDSSFNAGPYPFVYSLTVNGTTITYPNTGVANATTTCTNFNPGMGWPTDFTTDHVTAVGDYNVYMSTNTTQPKATYPRNLIYTNSIFTGTRGFASPGVTEGTALINSYLDKTSILIHHDVFGQRAAPNWAATTAYNLGFTITPTGSPGHLYTAVTSGISGGSQPAFSATGASCITDGTVVWQETGFRTAAYTEYQTKNVPIAPTTLYFTRSDFTYGATADSTTIGFKGSMNAPTSGTNACVTGTQVLGLNTALNISDWHDYALDSTSFYRNLAADGTDMGVSISAIENAQTRTKYVCGSPCGSGPTTD